MFIRGISTSAYAAYGGYTSADAGYIGTPELASSSPRRPMYFWTWLPDFWRFPDVRRLMIVMPDPENACLLDTEEAIRQVVIC